MASYQLLDIVRESGVFTTDEEADRTIQATLEALGECLSQGECRDIAGPLPEHYAASIRETGAGEPSPLDLERFVERVGEATDSKHPREAIQAVLSGLAEVVGEDELADARAQLPPAYGELFGPATIEPGATFVDVVAEESDFDRETARTAARETLPVLGHRLSEGEAEDLAPYLRGDAADWVSRTATHEAADFDAEAFVSRVATRADVDEERAREFTQAVGAALVEAVPEAERERAEAQLPPQFSSVLNLEA